MLAALLAMLTAVVPEPELSPRLTAFAATCQRERGVASAAFRRHLLSSKRAHRGFVVVLAGRDLDERVERAAVVATAAGAELRRVVLSSLIGKSHEATAAYVDALLHAAQKDGVVLFFDEADALFGKRTDVKDSHDRYANQEVSYLRARLQAIPDLIVVGVATPPAASESDTPAFAIDALLATKTATPPEPVRPWAKLCWPAR